MTEARIAAALRSVNSYYSSNIAWKDTPALELEQALRKRLEHEPGTGRQRLALAYIDTHKELESWLAAEPDLQVFSTAFLCRLHRSIYSRLARDDRLTRDGDELVPGEPREVNTEVGSHQPPPWREIGALLARAEEAYAPVRGLERRLIAIACAHHRLVWIHPFRNGNGRVMRLQSQAALMQHGAGSGLWSVARGFSLDIQSYGDRLAAADSLSEAGLVAFARYFLETCLEQIGSMAGMLDLATLRDRMAAYLVFLGETGERIALEAEPALHHVFLAGEVPRDEFKRMTGLPARSADKALAGLLRHGLLEADTTTGALRIGVPSDALDFYFPRLYLGAADRSSTP